MKRIILSVMFVVLIQFGFSRVLFASAAGELRERAKHLEKEADVMFERGNKELGGRLKGEAVWLLEAAERQGDRPDIAAVGELRERAKALRKEASAMLVLSPKVGERLVIGDNITVVVTRVAGNRVSLGIEAPDTVQIVRGELEADKAYSFDLLAGTPLRLAK